MSTRYARQHNVGFLDNPIIDDRRPAPSNSFLEVVAESQKMAGGEIEFMNLGTVLEGSYQDGQSTRGRSRRYVGARGIGDYHFRLAKSAAKVSGWAQRMDSSRGFRVHFSQNTAPNDQGRLYFYQEARAVLPLRPARLEN
jgi:hypothetical protein